MGWATFLGDFFTNSSGHPASKALVFLFCAREAVSEVTFSRSGLVRFRPTLPRLFQHRVLQGDQIGRIFAHLGNCFLWAAFEKKYKSSPNFGATFFHCGSYVPIFTKIGWAIFREIFSQTYLVTLGLPRTLQFSFIFL
jgi:hypothetical protein